MQNISSLQDLVTITNIQGDEIPCYGISSFRDFYWYEIKATVIKDKLLYHFIFTSEG